MKKYNMMCTFNDLMLLCEKHPEKIFKIENTNTCVGDIHSWRGSYEIPSMDYSSVLKTGSQIKSTIETQINDTHEGWKGGVYTYDLFDEFYISMEGVCSYTKIYGWDVNKDNEVVLLTEESSYW